jgi:DNA-binding response OmpR family regulator
MAATILIVEDEYAVARGIQYALQQEGYEVTLARSGEEGLEIATRSAPDLVLLDVRLPDIDGFAVCRELRSRSDVPIIMVTAKGEEIDRVVGLELGADDYVVKPFGLRELVARIRAVTRRTSVRPDSREMLVSGELEVDVPARKAWIGGKQLQLTPKEFDLLALLASEPGIVVDRERILREVWNTTWYGSSKTVDVHVAALRKKLGDPTLIETVRGVGLRLRG